MSRRGNSQNLRPASTPEEARERGRIGGIASGKARQQKKKLREELAALLTLPLKDEQLIAGLKALGLPAKSGMTLQTAINAAIIKRALKSDVRAFEAIRDTVQPLEVSDVTAEPVILNINIENTAKKHDE